MKTYQKIFGVVGVGVFLLFSGTTSAFAATLRLSPDTGVYTAGSTFSVRVVVNTAGAPINAAEGEISFNPSDLSVVSVSKAGSIFTLWTREPEFSNANGNISFGGGSPSGYTGNAGTVMSVTFRTKHAGTTQVTYAVGSVLAADGKGTNVVSSMQGGSYTVQAPSAVPLPEYVPPPNTPQAPVVTSPTHPDQDTWYKDTKATLVWKLPSGVIALRTLLDAKSTSIPTKVYDSPVGTVTLDDLSTGVSYFHIQYKNADGWGRVTHYRLSIDSEKPEAFTITPAEGADSASPGQRFLFSVKDVGSGIAYYLVQMDGSDRVRFESPKTGEHIYETPPLAPGEHTMVVEAYDKAENSIVATHSFTVDSFDAPVFTEYPPEVSSTVIPVIRGTTRPHALVHVAVRKIGATETVYETRAGEDGVFTFIPEGRFSEGVYELWATASDERGAQSKKSDSIRIAVQQPGLVRIGGYLVSVLSVVVPLLALIAVLLFLGWYLWHRIERMRRRLRKEVVEAEQSLAREFEHIVTALKSDIDALKETRKGKLTRQEERLVESLADNLENAEKRVRKEIEDIEKLVKR